MALPDLSPVGLFADVKPAEYGRSPFALRGYMLLFLQRSDL